MSIRRAADAGRSPWLGILFFLPGLNYLLILVLSILPTSGGATWVALKTRTENQKIFPALALATIIGLVGTSFIWISTNFFMTYGLSLFVGVPLILGMVEGYLFNYKKDIGFPRTIGLAAYTVVITFLFLIAFALEGAICILMALPITLTTT